MFGDKGRCWGLKPGSPRPRLKTGKNGEDGDPSDKPHLDGVQEVPWVTSEREGVGPGESNPSLGPEASPGEGWAWLAQGLTPSPVCFWQSPGTVTDVLCGPEIASAVSELLCPFALGLPCLWPTICGRRHPYQFLRAVPPKSLFLTTQVPPTLEWPRRAWVGGCP